MKYRANGDAVFAVWLLPVRGAWIEIRVYANSARRCLSLPVRGAWIEIEFHHTFTDLQESLPVRGARVEIQVRSSRHRKSTSLPVRGAWIEIKGAGKPLGQIIQLVDAVGQLLHLAHELSVTVYLKDCATQVMIQCHLVNPPTSYASRKIA